jgi:membrane-bound lytic murein transglycosylase D
MRMVLYTARRGDTLVTIADRFGVSLTQLRNWNHINGVKIEPGRRLHIAEPAGTAHASRRHRHEAAAPEKTTETASTKGSGHKTASTPAAKKKSGSAGESKHAQTPNASSTASKSEKAAAKKKSSGKRSKHSKSSSQ